MRTDHLRINIRRTFILVVGIVTASCSEKSAPEWEKNSNTSEVEKAESGDELQPEEDQIAEDCVAFVRSTTVGPARAASAECPGCSAGGTPILAFRGMKTDAVSCSGDTCTVVVTIRAAFTPGSGETVTGGLTAWLPPEQRSAYLRGNAPSDEQTYRVRITYKRRGEAWQAVEFDRAP